MTYYQLSNTTPSAFQVFLHTGHLPLNWNNKFKLLPRVKPQAPILLACFVLFVISYVSFVVIRVCDGQDQHVCSDNFLLQPSLVQPLTTAQVFKENSQLGQNDTRLLDYIRRRHIFPPGIPLRNKNVKTPSSFEAKSLAQFVVAILNSQSGFFVEVNCPDWEVSKTESLERDLGWTGVLIEADPKAFSDLRRKQRKAFLADVCLSTSDKPQEVIEGEVGVNQASAGAGIPTERSSAHKPLEEESVLEETELKCLPVSSILAALNRTTIDFFSLNAHGAELKVLQTIPFHTLFINIFSIQNVLHTQGRRKLMNFMASKGYVIFPGNLTTEKSTLLFLSTHIFSPSELMNRAGIYNGN